MTLANRLTLLRLALVPAFMCFMVFDHLGTRISSLLIFIIASITDWYDGAIARRTGTVTTIGAFLDPLVDKMLIAAALVGFVELHELHIPAWMVVLIISREFLITGLRTLAASRGIVLAAEQAGKFKMTSQITAIIVILLILILNATFEQWPSLLAARPEHHRAVLRVALEWVPFWLVFWVMGLTIISGFLYLRKYKKLLREELAMSKRSNARG